MIRIFVFLLLLVTAGDLFAFEDTFQVEDDLPYWTIFSQLANVGLLVLLLYFTQRKNISQAFKKKRDEYLEHVEAASQSKKIAEQKLADVSERLQEMQGNFQQQLSEAEKHAQESYRMQVAEAHNSAEKLKSMAQSNLEFEVQREIESLRVETFKKSANLAEKNLEKKLTPDQLKVWNSRFTEAKGVH